MSLQCNYSSFLFKCVHNDWLYYNLFTCFTNDEESFLIWSITNTAAVKFWIMEFNDHKWFWDMPWSRINNILRILIVLQSSKLFFLFTCLLLLFVWLVLFCFKTESHHVSLAGLELAICTMLALDSQSFACLCLTSARIEGMYHQT